jgi:threonine dehydratase
MLGIEDIREARARIAGKVYQTPCAHSVTLSRMLGCEVYLKLENLQMTGSFKERGALNKMLLLDDEQRAAGVITASAGNHAQAVAHAAVTLGIQATIVMPQTTPMAKVRGTREFGADIVLHGEGYDAAYEKARELQAERGYTFVHAFDDADVIAGQGTIGLELLEQVPDLDMVVVPVGGGGLIGGIAAAVKASRPQAAIVGVEAERIAGMKHSVEAGSVVPLPAAATIADGISVARVGELTLPLAQRYVDTLVTVSEEELAKAILVLLEREKTLAEGAGAAGFAGLYSGRVAGTAGKRVVVVISGGNIDMTTLDKILERGLEADGRVASLRVVIPDRPGSIADLAALVAGEDAEILNLALNRHVEEVRLGEAEVELTLGAKGHEHVAAIVAAIRGRGVVVK